MSYMIQWLPPRPMAASGSSMMMAKLWVSAGACDQASAGDMFCPPQPQGPQAGADAGIGFGQHSVVGEIGRGDLEKIRVIDGLRTAHPNQVACGSHAAGA